MLWVYTVSAIEARIPGIAATRCPGKRAMAAADTTALWSALETSGASRVLKFRTIDCQSKKRRRKRKLWSRDSWTRNEQQMISRHQTAEEKYSLLPTELRSFSCFHSTST